MNAKILVIEYKDGGFSVHVTSGGAMPLSVALRQAEAVRRETRSACVMLSPAIQKMGLPAELYSWDLQKAISTALFHEAVEGRADWLARKSQRDLREKAIESQRLRKEALGYRCR